MLSIVAASLLLLVVLDHSRPLTMEQRIDAWEEERRTWGFRK